MINNDKNEIIWSVGFIQKYQEIWCWTELSSRNNLQWSIELIEFFIDKWNWSELSANSSLPWSVELIEPYKDKWNWSELSANSSLPWSLELVELYKNKWHCSKLSSISNLPWSMELIELYKDEWNWPKLIDNSGLPWSIELINFYKTNLWDQSEEYHENSYWLELSAKSNLPWSMKLIEIYKEKWNWSVLSSNLYIPWSVELIELYKNKWDWKNLSSNNCLPLSIKLIERFENKWNWDDLSDIWGDFWTIELIKNFEDKWNWQKLSSNRSIPWSKELIKQFQNKWKYCILHKYNRINWSKELLQENDSRNICHKESKTLSELLELYDNNWFEIEWELKHNLPTKINAWSLEDDEICEKFIEWNSNIENTFLQLQDWLELHESDYLHKIASKITKNGYNKDTFKVTFKKWADVFWRKISVSNKITFKFISDFKNDLDWNILTNNSSLNWTLKEIELFATYLQVNSRLFTVLKPHLNNTVVNSLLDNAPLRDSKVSPYTQEHSVFSALKFGNYKGKSIYEIFKLNPTYINWCIINLDHFYIDDSAIMAIKIFYPQHELTPIAIKILEKKADIKESEAQFEINKNYNDDYEKPQSFEDWLESEFDEEAGTAYWNLE